MARPPAVNDQITDAITQTNTKALGEAPAMALGNLFAQVSQAVSHAAQNTTNQQQQSQVVAQGGATMAAATRLSLDTASTGAGIPDVHE